jgi:hypothetical protein
LCGVHGILVCVLCGVHGILVCVLCGVHGILVCVGFMVFVFIGSISSCSISNDVCVV